MFKLFSFVSLTFLFGCSTPAANDADNGGGTGNGIIAPGFTLDAYPSGKVSLSDYNGKVVYLFFVGYNCPPCIASAPATQSEIADTYDPGQVQVIALDIWDGNVGGVANFQIQTGVKYPVLMKASAVGTAYGASNDYSVLVDKKGRITYSAYGVNIAALKEKIDRLIKE